MKARSLLRFEGDDNFSITSGLFDNGVIPV